MKALLICISLLLFNLTGFTQVLTQVDFISPFHEGLAAVQKNKQWGFMDEQGQMVIDFRNDIVPTGIPHDGIDKRGISLKYPIFKENMCLIKKNIEGVFYYGFIDKKGKEIIAPQFLNATNFNHGYAIVIQFETKLMGTNKVLDKRMVSYKMEEYIIDASGNLIKYLNNARNITPAKLGTNEPPPNFESNIVAPRIVAVKNKDRKWDLIKF